MKDNIPLQPVNLYQRRVQEHILRYLAGVQNDVATQIAYLAHYERVDVHWAVYLYYMNVYFHQSPACKQAIKIIMEMERLKIPVDLYALITDHGLKYIPEKFIP